MSTALIIQNPSFNPCLPAGRSNIYYLSSNISESIKLFGRIKKKSDIYMIDDFITSCLQKLTMKTFLLSLLLISLNATSQPFIEEITAFKIQDSIHFPAKKSNLFVGSSSFRLWHNIKQDGF